MVVFKSHACDEEVNLFFFQPAATLRSRFFVVVVFCFLRSRLFHPLDEVNVKTEARNGCCHMGNYSALRSERTHKASLPSAAGQPARRPGCLSESLSPY